MSISWLQNSVINKLQVIYARPGRTKILVPSNEIVEVASFIKDTLGFDHAESVSGTDYPKDNQIEVIYHLRLLFRR